MNKEITKLLRRLADQGVRKLFPEAEMKMFDKLPKGMPDPHLPIEEARRIVGALELFPKEWRCWVLNRDRAVKLFLVLGISPKDDSFTFELAWSLSGRLPNAKMLDPGEEGDANELIFRLGRLWGADSYDQWWYVGRRRTPTDIAVGTPDDPVDLKLADVQPKVDDALEKVRRYAVPYLAEIARRYGVHWRRNEPMSRLFYQVILEKPDLGEARGLLEELLRRQVEFEQLQQEVTSQIVENRTRRDGRKPRLTKRQKELIAGYSVDEAETERQLREHSARLERPEDIVRCALKTEQQQIGLDRLLLSSVHRDDRHWAEKPLAHKCRTVQIILDFMRSRGWQEGW